jgi:IS5 family transposase
MTRTRHALDWASLEQAFGTLYSDIGRSVKPIRLMCALLMLKQLHNLTDEPVVEQWRMNPYYKVFCGELEF